MGMPVSRRTFLLGFGGGIASASVVWAAWKYHLWPHAAVAERYAVSACCKYVDYAGWLVTKADKDRLTLAGSIPVLDGTLLEGRPLADGVASNVEACESWCLREPDCQGFSYGKPSHPDPHMQSRCWLKRTSELSPVSDPRFISGRR
jgi:hypothetical protein